MKTEHIILGALGLLLFLPKKRQGIGAIYPTVPDLYECNDGTYSTSRSKRACHRHGGRKSDEPLSYGGGGSGLLNIRDVPLSAIHINRDLFQGREKAYSKRSVDNIVEDAMAGRFAWENLDPITLWSAPDGKLYLLSGHSRHKAFELLAAEGILVDGKGFEKIPAKIRTGSLESAQRMALESNTLSTKETDIERAAYYRRLKQDGMERRKLLEAIKKNEGRNWSNIYAYTFLSPTGKTWATLKQFAEGEDQSATLAKTLAKWVGTARRDFPFLTNEHEAEIFAWLFENRGYGTGTGQVSNERDFADKMATVVQKNTFFGQFDQSKPLNIMQAQLKSPVEIEYDRAIQEKTRQIAETEKEIKLKIRSLTDRKASRDDIARIIQPLETGLRNLRVELSRLVQKKSEVIEYSKQEATLFGLRGHRIGRRSPHF